LADFQKFAQKENLKIFKNRCPNGGGGNLSVTTICPLDFRFSELDFSSILCLDFILISRFGAFSLPELAHFCFQVWPYSKIYAKSWNGIPKITLIFGIA